MIVLSVLSFGQSSFYPAQVVVDTTRFTRPADTTSYTSGDLIGSTARYSVFSGLSSNSNARGTIKYVTVEFDSLNSAQTTSVKVRLFSVSDTTGLWTSLVADNAVFQSKFQTTAGRFLWFSDVAITLTGFGTTAGGATSAEGNSTASIPYQLFNGKLYAVVIATSFYKPKLSGTVKITIHAEAQY